tara:strand:+ start:3400 stop:3522 length:123 start_codon:yes stop_codon:yes gene_type:complete
LLVAFSNLLIDKNLQRKTNAPLFRQDCGKGAKTSGYSDLP